MSKTLPRSFFRGFVLKSTLLFAGGALLTVALFSFAFPDQGTSYAESYKLLAEADRVLVDRSLMVFCFTLLLSIAGIVVLAIVYSHRVAGALHMLGMHTRRVASGDLAKTVKLRSTDVIHDLADDFNNISGHYRGLLALLEIKTRELAVIIDHPEQRAHRAGNTGLSTEISERTLEIKALLDQIKL
jgi:methyl-accepting chemotaxis protein